MPRRADLRRILVLGAGPIVIGQGCEFDYSGTQGIRALRAEGYEVVLVNSNPATIMTDPELADRTYVEPLDLRAARAIVEKERPSAILPTLGGQTALNLALGLEDDGTLARLGVELLGARPAAIRKAEDRALFKAAMEKIGLACPRAVVARSIDEARAALRDLGLPLILRPSFTLGGTGGGIVRSEDELEAKVLLALSESPSHEVLVEESLLGWKEFELEVIRDRKDNFIVVCTIENLDPLGVHTGDSITVAPAMTLTDKEYQRLRDAARAVMSEIGVETGGANVQFAVRPDDGAMRVIEMNPRVSRSSALASKATGYPIAKIATKLAVGYSLDELRNDLTGTSAAFEPAIDYVVVKWPRFAFDKFPDADDALGTQMKSVGETMAIGRTFAEAVQKAARGLETGLDGLTPASSEPRPLARILELAARPNDRRLLHVVDALRAGASHADVVAATAIDPWFIAQLQRVVDAERAAAAGGKAGLARAERMTELKRLGLSDARLAKLVGATEDEVRAMRDEAGVRPTFARVDTCAAEIPGTTPYLYATWESESDDAPRSGTGKPKVVVLGAGPNRIGQGIEFDYCCVHAVAAARELGFEAIMVNSNPETVSTDYDVADRLYFEPITLETVLAICDVEKPDGVLVQLGGQTPLRLANALAARGLRLFGTSADAIDRAEDRGRFDAVLEKLGLRRPASAVARSRADVHAAADRLGWPVLVRPSYVLGGRAMKVARTGEELDAHLARMPLDSDDAVILVDRFLADAIEVDVDCVSDGSRVVIGAVMEHLERAGVHSGDSATVLPPLSLRADVVDEIERVVRALALELGVVGLMNTQLAVKDDQVYVLEVNPRASRTVPFVSKATGMPLARIATKVMLGKTLDELGVSDPPLGRHVAAKECVFPFKKLPGADTVLGPEMRSTGEVMGVGETAARAYAKALRAIGIQLRAPRAGEKAKALLAVSRSDQSVVVEIARRLRAIGFAIAADTETAGALAASRLPAEPLSRDAAEDALRRGDFAVAIVTAEGDEEIARTRPLRSAALARGIPCFTTTALARAGCSALEEDDGTEHVRSLQEWYALA
ncbi:MAG: carbamoyl-phosphate synthase large subunit [Labilithrix sp.]|nr:carbamoyl-phosphate synthase large subunit [Labilithrix sp.]